MRALNASVLVPLLLVLFASASFAYGVQSTGGVRHLDTPLTVDEPEHQGGLRSGAEGLRMNEGRRFDLVVDQVRDPTGQGRGLYAMTRALWSQSDELRSWFMMVDRISDPGSTVLMTLALDYAGVSGGGAGVRGDATVTVTMIDPQSGIFLASATSTQQARAPTRDLAVRAAMQAALEDAFYMATRTFGGN